jgi:hypothetical protein
VLSGHRCELRHDLAYRPSSRPDARAGQPQPGDLAGGCLGLQVCGSPKVVRCMSPITDDEAAILEEFVAAHGADYGCEVWSHRTVRRLVLGGAGGRTAGGAVESA